MPEQPAPPDNQEEQVTKIRILQINLNKSERAHLDIINENISKRYDVILIQEPHTTTFNAIRTPTNFRPVFPSNRFTDDSQIRSVIWVNKHLETKSWKIIDIRNTSDITAIQLTGTYGKVTIFNIYNDCTHSRTEDTLRNFLTNNRHSLTDGDDTHMIWAGDFNRHHPLWDDDRDVHLFTRQALREAEGLIELMADYGMEMALPKGIPTLQHMRTKRYSRPDNVLCTAALRPFVINCEVNAQIRPTSTDHFPINTNINLPQARIPPDPTFNFRTTDWDEFKKTLTTKLDLLPRLEQITNAQQLEEEGNNLTRVLQETIEEKVTRRKPRPDAKRWWNGDLTKMRKELNRLRTESYHNRAIANHASHRNLRKKSKSYGKAIISAKRAHWTEYLEEMTAGDIWTANKYLSSPIGDGGLPRIPTIKARDDEGNILELNDNADKARVFAKTFFPPPPQQDEDVAPYDYPDPLPDPQPPDKPQIERAIRRLSPYKAPGPDGIPNVVLQKCYALIADRLTYIYRAILELEEFFDPWREFTTIVLRKPDKPNYEIPKAYRPIALISTMSKVLTAIVAENISQLVEQNQLLPKTHFGGRPGRTTTDAIHYLTHKIKTAWAGNQVASVLFLDVEGAFPNAVTKQLIHNLRKRRIPEIYTKFIRLLLTNRRTKIKFDDFTSETVDITNGIGQGDPLSMILYILYNADLLEITENDILEDALGYVDDVALVAIGRDFEETTARLQNMMVKQNGGMDWSRTHNSRFEMSKSAVLHLTRRTTEDPEDTTSRISLPKPPLIVDNQTIAEVQSYKYLGVQIDTQLRWKEQVQRAVSNATKWLLQYRRLTRPSSGTNARLMRQLYISVALPKITYGLDIWYTPPTKRAGQTRSTGSAAALRQLQKTQRIATLAIIGALRTTPTDFADAHAGLLPIELALLKATHRATIRLLTLPPTHPLHSVVNKTRHNPPKKHASPIANLLRTFKLANARVETILTTAQNPPAKLGFAITIAGSRNESIEKEKKDDAEFKVFSDGSGVNDGIGAAAVLYTKERFTPIGHLKVFLGPQAKHNTYEAEAAGAILATHLLAGCPETIGKKVSLYIDNQSVLASMSAPKANSGQHLIKHLVSSANELACNLGIHWISSHSKVKGNEKVDELAKEAANGLASARTRLPHIFKAPLPVSASATKQAYHEKLKKKWEGIWETSDRSRKLDEIDDNFPFHRFRKRTYQLSRHQSSLMAQLRCGHIPLNNYLHRIGKSETDLCQACEEGVDVPQRRETVKHFLFECTAFQQDRDILTDKIGRDHLNLRDIMLDTDRMRALASFISRTGRFKRE
jgi:ribonuclease HI